MDTLLLDPDTWDLIVDASRNIAVAKNPYALAQDAASFIRLFRGELYYDTTQGVPYWEEDLGKRPPIALLKGKINNAALDVPEIIKAVTFIASIDNKTRRVVGQVQVTDKNDVTIPFGF